MAFLGAVMFAVWKIAKWAKPHVDATLAAQRELCNTLQANDAKHIEALYAIRGTVTDGHQITHQKLELVQRDLSEIKNNVAK